MNREKKARDSKDCPGFQDNALYVNDNTETTPPVDSSASGLRLRDFARVSLHEAAHCAIATKLGYIAHWRIFETGVVDWRDGTFYCGKTYLLSHVEDSSHRRLIGLAGGLAEILIDFDQVDSSEAAWLLTVDSLLSDTDAATADGYCESDIDLCLELLRECWPSIIQDAQRARGESAWPEGDIARELTGL